MSQKRSDENKPPAEHDAPPSEIEPIQKLFADLPRTYPERYEKLLQLSHSFRTEVAAALQPVLQSHLASLPTETYEQKQALASWLNGQLRQIGLAVRCPKTGEPGILVADIKSSTDRTGRFRIALRGSRGEQTKTHSQSLEALELIEDNARTEAFGKWKPLPTGEKKRDR